MTQGNAPVQHQLQSETLAVSVVQQQLNFKGLSRREGFYVC